ncbi:hypothetical protein NP493_702g03016 [Ridgeia piscesae]|uniref:Uncharacterized protein n=1 Tax=Ridgeia piscesae TaxID=27915 RepID=A0AAD9KR57_RIDPI|nr:hypothetical protein NP493_702g03016 [Ridgeia piscesae]
MSVVRYVVSPASSLWPCRHVRVHEGKVQMLCTAFSFIITSSLMLGTDGVESGFFQRRHSTWARRRRMVIVRPAFIVESYVPGRSENCRAGVTSALFMLLLPPSDCI